MSNNTALTQTTNIVPVQGIFTPDPNFALVDLIGPAGRPFYPNINPVQSGLTIVNSTINSSVIGGVSPSTATFTNLVTTTGQVNTSPVNSLDLANKAYVDATSQGLSFKQPANVTTIANITLSGLQTIDGYTTLAGDRVLVRSQTAQADNGIYIAAVGAWSRSADANTYAELLAAYLFVLQGTIWGGSSWVCTNIPGGTLGVTSITFVQFSNNAIYTAGTGLNLTGFQFSIANTAVTAGTFGSASKSLTAAVNAQGQLTSLTAQDIAIANTQVSGLGTMSTQNANNVSISGGSITGTPISGSTVGGSTITASTQFSGPGTGLTGTATSLSIGGNAATATSATTAGSATTATTATNLAGGTTGSVPYQSLASTTAMLGIGSTGQVLTVAAGLPSWANLSTLGVTSFSAGTTGLTPATATSGAITLAGTLATTNGGTALTSFTSGGAVYATSTSALTTGTLPVLSGGTGVTTSTGTVSVVLSTSPTLVTPILGTPTSVTLTNATGLPLTTGVTGVLPIANGGNNGTAVPTAGAIAYGSGTAYAFTLAGTSGQVLTSAGAGTPTWTTPTAYATVTDDTTTAATRYPLFAAATSGNLLTSYTSSTKYQYNPSTGVLTATGFAGAGTGLTGTATSLSIGGNAATATSATSATTATNLAGGAASQIPYQTGSGATAFIANGTSGQVLQSAGAGVPTWVTFSGGATIVDDTTTNATRYPLFAAATSGTLSTSYTSSTKYQFNPSTGVLTSPIVSTTSNFTFPDASTQNTAAIGFGFKNRLINGCVNVDQRNLGASQTIVAGAALAYTVDRWYAYSIGANVTGQQIVGVYTSAQYQYKFTGAALVTGIGFGQRIEAKNSFDLANTTATLSCYISNSLLTTVTWTAYYANTTDSFGTLASPTVTSIATGTFTVSSTRTRYTTNISIPSAATTGIQIVFSVGPQLTGTWIVDNFQLEKGSTATSFDYRDYGRELIMCQRYLPVLDFAGGNAQSVLIGQANATTSCIYTVIFPVQTRTPPTSVSLTTAQFNCVTALGGLSAISTVTFNSGSIFGSAFSVVTSGLVGGNASALYANTSAAKILWNGCEL